MEYTNNNPELISVNNLLEDNKIDFPNFLCLSSDPANFKLLRVQPTAQFSYSQEAGPAVCDKQLDIKCKNALSLANDNAVGLVLFPEYCISYSLLKELVLDPNSWPFHKSLWCLPCQAIKLSYLFAFLEYIRKQNDVILLDKYCTEQYFNRNAFVNILFYCFTVYQDNKLKLVLIPQMKMHAMSDPTYLCESAGLTIGNVLYYFKGQHVCLLSLICADVYRVGITWQDLCAKTSCDHLIMLHPQLNTKPKEEAFQHIRREMMERNSSSLYIACNWAVGTTLAPTDGEEGQTLNIHFSWSCIYRKYEADVDWHRVSGDRKGRLSNIEEGIFTGIISNRRTLVWFTDSQECLHIIQVGSPYSTNFAVANQFHPFKARGLYSFSEAELTWMKSSYQFSFQHKFESEPSLAFVGEHLGPYWDKFPLNAGSKDDFDQFFALACCRQSSALEMDSTSETPAAWSLLLNDEDVSNADKELTLFLKLIRSMNYFPPHLKAFENRWRFVYLPPDQKRREPPANLQLTSQNGRRLIVAFANSEREARHHLEYLGKNILSDSEDTARKYVCVFYENPVTTIIEACPKVQTHITDGDAIKQHKSIIDGGEDDDMKIYEII